MDEPVKVILSADGKPLKLAIDGAVVSLDKLGRAASASAATTTAGFGAARAGIGSISKSLDAAKESVRSFALTAAGIFSASQLIRMATEASSLATTMERYSNTLKFASGSTASFAANNAFLQTTVRTLGLDLQSASQQFASLTAAAKGTSLEGAGARSIFDAVGKAATVMGLTADQTSGSLLAISQMISKGTVSAEELRGQLGERLPGAFQIAARAMGVTTAELGKMLEAGALATDVFLPRFAAQMRLEVGGAVESAADSVQANLNRVRTDWASLVTTVNNSAFNNEALKGIDQFLTVLTGTLKGSKDDFRGWGDTVADVLAFVGDAATSAIRIVGAVGNAYGAAAALAGLYVDKVKALDALKYDYSPQGRAQALAIQANYDAATQAVRDGAADVAKAVVSGSTALRDGLARQREQVAAAANDPELKRLAARSRAALDDADRALLATKPVLGGGKASTEAAALAKNQAQAYNDLIAAIQGKIAAEKLEAELGQKLSDAQKEQINIDKLVAQGKISVKAATSDKTKAVLAELAAAERAAAVGKAQIEANIEVSRQQARFHADEARDVAAYAAAQTRASEQSLKAVAEKLDALRLEERAVALSTSANITLAQAVEQLAIARLQEKQAMYRPGSEGFVALQKEIDLRRELLGVMVGKEAREASVKGAKEAAEAWAKASDSINTTLTDALMRGFESGKTFAENLRDTVVNMFRTLVLRPVVSAVVSPVAQGLTGALGLAGAANAAGGASGLLGAASMFGSGGLGGALAGGAGWLTGATSLTGALSAGASLIGTGSMAGLASGVGMLAGALGPIALGIGVLSSLFGGKKNSQQNTGNATSFYDASGALTRQDMFFGGSSASADSVLAGLQQAYAKAAAGLAIGTVSTAFNFGSSVRKDGTDPRFALGGYAGDKSFQQTETASSDAAISLAASRAVFAALQGSELPAYLAGVFNSIDPGAASQEQITATLAFAQSLKQVREALTETRTPLQILQDNLVTGTAALKTSAETFKTDFVAAIDAGMSPEALAQWQGLQVTMDQLATASGKADEAITAVTRSLADIANERSRLQDQYDSLTLTSAQLIAKQRDGLDESNRALFDQVQALIALKDAASASAEAAQASAAAHAAAAATERAAAGQRLSQAGGGASDALAGLQRAVAAQQAADTAAYQAQKDAAGALYKAQASALQTSMDTARASLDAVSTSVGRLKSLSGSLKSSLDGMRIAGSDGATRADAQAQIGAALARARSGGGLPLDGELNNALATVARPSEQLFATFSDYAKDFYRTANDISALSSLTDAQLTADEATQVILKAQVDTLNDQQKLLKDGFDDQVSSLDAILSNAQRQLDAANGINTSVLSVAEALAVFNQSILGLTAERARQDLATSRGTAYSKGEIVTAVRGALQSGYSVADVYNTAADSYGVGASTITNATNGQGLTGFDTATGARTQDYAQGQIADAIRYNLDHGMSIADIYRLGGANYGLTGAEIARAGKAASIPGFRVGTNYVPQDMLAQIHQGEAIVPRAYNPAAGGSAGNNSARLEALVEKLIAQVADLYASSEHGNAEIARGSNAVNGKQGAPIVVQIIDKNGVLA